MRNLKSIIISFIVFISSNHLSRSQMEITYPVPEKKPKELAIHGDVRIDNYYWLRERENSEVIKYLKDENAYTEWVMKDTKELQDKLYNEIIGRIKQTDMSVPYKDNGYFYYSRYEEKKEYPVYCRKKGSLDATEEIMLDVNEMAEGYDYYQVVALSVSPDNKWLAYGVDTLSRRLYTIYFKNLVTGETLELSFSNAAGNTAWASDSKTFFFTEKDTETLRPGKIFRGSLDGKEKELVYEEPDMTYYAYVYKMRSKKYIVIGSSARLSDEYRLIDADKPYEEPRLFQEREKDHEYSIGHFKDKFYIQTNYHAKNFRLMITDENKTGMEYWEELIPHKKDVLIEGFMIFNDYLVVAERVKGLTELRVIHNETNKEHYVDYGEETYYSWFSNNPEMDTEVLRFGFTSLTTPSSVFDYNMNTGEKKLLKQQEVVGDFSPDNYTSRRLYATADDGTQIPISLVYNKEFGEPEQRPLLLYGYGSYGFSEDPVFSSVRLSLLDRGFIFALAHIRGGQEMGRDWYDNGKLLKKKNTFTDFIACGDYLVENGFTTPEKIMAMGGSAGGLLMGAVINMRPDLFHGVVAAVPFVDVITTMLDESIPLTTSEYDEWGNPNDKTYYDYILSYSPYDNVEKKEYPNLLVTTGLHDSQVQYWEPAKWVAKLREYKTGDNLLLLYTDMSTGHSGSAGRFKRHKDTAQEYAFFLMLLGINE